MLELLVPLQLPPILFCLTRNPLPFRPGLICRLLRWVHKRLHRSTLARAHYAASTARKAIPPGGGKLHSDFRSSGFISVVPPT